MAHTVHIPVSFDFRTVIVEWHEVVGRIVGWAGEDFTLEVELKRGRKRRIKYSGDHVPYELRHKCLNTLGEDDYLREYDGLVESICADFRPHVFVPLDQPYSLSFEDVFDFEDWADDTDEDSDDDDDDSEEAPHRSLPANAWQLRDAFLRVTPEPRRILRFLNRWGRWKANNYLRVNDFVNLQAMVRQALVSPPEEWFEQDRDDLDSVWDRRTKFPYFAVETFDCEPAIRMTVTIDLLRQVKFKTCERADCGQPFSIASAHKRKYCTQYCGHLESVRRSRHSKVSRARAARASA